MKNVPHNGWHNYETWVVALWLDNDESTQEWAREQAEEAVKRAERSKDSNWTLEELATSEVEDSLREFHEELATSEVEDSLREFHEEQLPKVEGFAADLLNAAMSEVNWREIARHLVDEVIAEAKI